ncbi:thermonuclease family protein [Caenibius sp. WL]|nr:thermonuclease family protein [Caenibius sp. WL]
MFLSAFNMAFGQDPQTVMCRVQWVHDGDTFRCDGYARALGCSAWTHLRCPGSCRPGRVCTPGDSYASKAYLERLIGNRTLECDHFETDHYGRPVMRCWAGGRDLSCAMVKGGMAVERYGRLNC